MTKTPSAVTATLEALRDERASLAARLDAVDLAIDNLGRVYELRGAPPPKRAPRPRRATLRRKAKTPRAGADKSDAAARRVTLMRVIAESEVGLTTRELSKRTPEMDDKARSNALQLLRSSGQIRRAGNAWVKAA